MDFLDDKALLDRCQSLVALAKSKGADEVEVWAEAQSSASANLEHNDLKGASSDDQCAFGVRVIKGGALGFAYVNRTDDDALKAAAEDALAIARSTPADDANGLATPDEVSDVEGLNDDAIWSLSVGNAIASAKEMNDAARAVDERVSIDSGSFSFAYGATAIATSTDIALSAKDAALTYSLYGMAVSDDEVGSFDYEYRGHRAAKDARPRDLGERFGQKVIALLGTRACTSYKGKVLFMPEVYEEIFLSPLLAAIDGDNVLKGKSRLADKRGARVAGPGFNLVEDGTRAGVLYSSPFDREGRARKRTPLVDDGVLQDFLYDVRAAKRASTSPTGHAQGSARSQPSIGTTNVTLETGDSDEKSLFDGLGSGLFVSRFSGTVDNLSGDFSGVAKGAFWVQDGAQQYPVKETLIAGNAFSLLEQIVARGNKLHDTVGYEGPLVLVDGLDVTAG